MAESTGPQGLPHAPVAPDSSAVAAADRPYRSLSVFALVGVGVAGVYAVAVVLLAVVALFKGSPLLLGPWTALVPAGALALCLLGRSQIRSSEGTVAGDPLVRWGVRLSLFVGLGYWAYYAAVYLAVRQQARAFADEWVDHLLRGDETRAILSVLPPLKRLHLRPDDPDLLRALELRMAAMELPEQPASLVNLFHQHALVRFLSEAGKQEDVRTVSCHVRDWEYTRGGYEVALEYEFETAEGTFQAVVTVRGLTAPDNEYEQREWYVSLVPDKTRLILDDREGGTRITAFGNRVEGVYKSAREFFSTFQRRLTWEGNREGAFLLTLPPDERMKAVEDMLEAERLGAVAGPALAALPQGQTLARYNDFTEGYLVRIDEKRFLAPPPEREAIANELRAVLGTSPPRSRLDIPNVVPRRVVDKDRIRVFLDATVAEQRKHFIECVVEVEGDAGALKSADVKPEWRVVTIWVVSGRRMPSQ